MNVSKDFITGLYVVTSYQALASTFFYILLATSSVCARELSGLSVGITESGFRNSRINIPNDCVETVKFKSG